MPIQKFQHKSQAAAALSKATIYDLRRNRASHSAVYQPLCRPTPVASPPLHYQPLSHALHPPQAQAQLTYTSTGMFNLKAMPGQSTQREEEEEEEEDGDDEGIVAAQLNQEEPAGQGSNPSSPQPKPTSTADAQTGQQPQDNSQEQKRRPGRPRGSKNRKPRVGSAAIKPETNFYAGVTPPRHPDVNAHNQQYYEFQWRVLNLCAEFYGAAEELVKGTQPLVIAQCYQMGPGNKVDPLVMLSEAKRICDTLLANPSQLISQPPPPIYPVTPYQPPQTQPVPSTSVAARPPTSASKKAATASTVISTPGTFVMPLAPPQTGYPHTQYSMYAPPGQYPTTSYYQYSYVTPGSYYSPQQPIQPVTPQTQPVAAASATQPAQTTQPEASSSTAVTTTTAATTTNVISTAGGNVGGNQGAWSEEETERLKKLAEDSRAVTPGGEIEWDWVVHQWGSGRTRHQILIKATSLGLKESSTRGVKRRRGETECGASDAAASPAVAATPTATANAASTSTNTTSTTANPTSASPAHSQTASSSTPAASPALQNQQRPAPPPPPKAASNLPWPMPTVAVNTPSPVMTAANTASAQGQEQQRTSYYRARPNQDAASATGKPPSSTATHSYMYQPNGSAGSSRLGKENGK
ncbi:hypothetical protein LshimejAT787_0800110 [Lyophyllum shimeji]|uniref:Myb-like domain-containing protein n=1 Tax=Lyophyllum shimeji TaxID=47721 RepID=A0A9P3PPA7_LYOSH|nr:hypothetical protein LshimejAT787_0800110 [Lyophyllum shimeji]